MCCEGPCRREGERSDGKPSVCVNCERYDMCCSKPCLSPDWQDGKYGLRCINCGHFRET